MALPPLKNGSFIAGGIVAISIIALLAGCSSNKSSSGWDDFQPVPPPGSVPLVVPGAAATQKPTVAHVVEQGDTLWELAMEYQTTVREIKEANSLATDMIRVGQTIKIPTNTPPAGATPAAPAAPTSPAPAPATAPALSPAPAPAPTPTPATVTPGAGTQVIESVPQPQAPAPTRTAPPPPSPPPPRPPSYQPDPNMQPDDFNVPSIVPGN